MTVRSVIFDIIGRDNASKAFLSSAASAETAAKKMEASAAAMTKAGATLTRSITVPVVALAAAAIKEASDFQKSMALIQTAGGETAAKANQIAAGIKQIAVETGTTLQQLGAGAYIVAKSMNTQTAAAQLTTLKAAAEGARAENVDLGTAVTALTSVMQSYGVAGGDAVSVENELVKASGLAKTTMTDFANSLSNVIPLASSLHISFAQVAGAIDTMTQHGESAQQSTDNLNNLIRNLAGQNNVASAAMQQLGINTIKLKTSLSTEGLTGALNTVEKALAANSKGGVVVLNTFKQAALATDSLKSMLDVMSRSMLKQSEGLLNGAVSIKAYRTFVRDLGGEAGAAGTQFLSLYQASQGFNDALKSGNSNVATTAQELQKMLGGATGLNVALMLSGNSAKTFSNDVNAVAAAASKSGANISTWATTSQTMAVKAAQAREQLQVLAVNVGNQLIPIATEALKVFSGLVGWFSNLSKGTQQTIIKVALLAATLGPLLSITGRLIATGVKLWEWGKTVAAAMGLVTVASRATTTAVTAATDSALIKGIAGKLGVEGAAAGAGAGEAAAAGGATALGGLGAVALPVTALMVGGKFFSDWLESGKSSLAVMGNLDKTSKAWQQTLIATDGALNANGTAIVKASVQQDGLAAKAAKAHLSLNDLSTGISGSTKQFDDLVAAWKAGGKPSGDTVFALQMLHAAFLAASAGAKAATLAQSTAIDKSITQKSAIDNLTAAITRMGGTWTGTVKNVEANPIILQVLDQQAQTTISGLQVQINGLRQYTVPSINVDTSQAEAAMTKLLYLATLLGVKDGALNDQTSGPVPSLAQMLTGQGSTAKKVSDASAAATAKAAAANAVKNAGAAAANIPSPTIASNNLGGGGGGGGGSAAASPKFSTSTLTAFLKSLAGTNQDVGDAFAAVIQSAVAAGKFNASLVKSLTKEDQALRVLVSRRNAITALEQSAQTIGNAVLGTFDVSQVKSQYTDQGTSTSTIIQSLQLAVANASKFSGVIKQLVKRHTAPGLIAQLLTAGPAALPQAQALLAASPSQLALINRDFGQLNTTADTLASSTAKLFYSAGVQTANGLIAGLKSQASAVNKAVTELADRMVAQMKKSLGIKSPSTVFHDLGVNTGLGFINGVTSQHGGAQKAVAGLTNHGTPSGQHGSWVKAEKYVENEWNITEAQDPWTTVNILLARQAHRSRG